MEEYIEDAFLMGINKMDLSGNYSSDGFEQF